VGANASITSAMTKKGTDMRPDTTADGRAEKTAPGTQGPIWADRDLTTAEDVANDTYIAEPSSPVGRRLASAL
jgi:hypothetical protein